MRVDLTDTSHPALLDYRNLTDVAWRRRHEVEGGLYMAESLNVIRRALAAGHKPRSFLVSPRALRALEPDIGPWLSAECATPVYVGAEEVLREVAGFRVHRGALAAMGRPEPTDARTLLETVSRVCVLEDLVDHTNVGAAFRSVAALGFDAVVLTPRCADPLYRRAVRVSMGTVFQVPWARLSSWPATEVLREAGYTSLSLALSEDSLTLDEAQDLDVVRDPSARLAIIVGSEGDGLSRRTIATSDYVVRIPMASGVDSLNVASATAVALWALRRC